MTKPSLEERWLWLSGSLGYKIHSQRSALWEMLVAAYVEPHRRYHTLGHIEDGLDVLDKLGAAPVTQMAFWWHDFVCFAGAKDNEERSAAHASAVFGSTSHFRWEVQRLILLTKTHEVEWFDKNGCDLVVADLHGLAADPETYRRNSENIRKEYSAFSDHEWTLRRLSFLDGMMARPRLFPPLPEYQGLAGAAEDNIRAERSELRAKL